jgi:hypothetical protein
MCNQVHQPDCAMKVTRILSQNRYWNSRRNAWPIKLILKFATNTWPTLSRNRYWNSQRPKCATEFRFPPKGALVRSLNSVCCYLVGT